MRSAILVAITLIVVGAGFGVYWALHGGDLASDPAKQPVSVTTRPAQLPGDIDSLVGPGDVVWWERFDKDTGERSSRLRADRYEPMPDGRVLVVNPVAEFFSYDTDEEGNQFVDGVTRIVGERGIVAMEEGFRSNQNSIAGGTPSRTPRSGELFDVTLYTYESLEKAEADSLEFLKTNAVSPNATMTLLTHNCSFDSETFRVATEAYIDDDGLTVTPDRVKVTVRGNEYEFDGYGLTMQYNQRDRRVEYLRIAHGERLRVLKPGQFLDPKKKQQSTPPASVSWSNWTPGPAIPGLTLASAGNWMLTQAVGGQVRASTPAGPTTRRRGRRAPVAATQPTTRPRPESPVYRATFKDQVHVVQAGETLASGQVLQIDFLESGAEEEKATTQPVESSKPATAAPTTRPVEVAAATPLTNAPTTRPANRPARRGTRPAGRAERVAMTTEQPASQPSTQPSDQPIDIFWTGPLEVVPLRTARPERIAPGEAIVRLIGDSSRPAEGFMRSEGTTTQLKGATLSHWTVDSGVLVEEGPGVGVELRDSKGLDIQTHRLTYSPSEGTAILQGQSTARLPVDEARPQGADPAAPAKPVFADMSWSEVCTISLEGASLEQMIWKRADVVGNVRLNHPDMSLASRELVLFMAPEPERPQAPTTKPTTRPSRRMPPIKEAHATGAAHLTARKAGAVEPTWNVRADDLRVLMERDAEGELYPRQAFAQGNVDAIEPGRRILADDVALLMKAPQPKPATRPVESVAQAPTTRPAKSGFELGDLEHAEARGNVRVTTADGNTAEGVRMTIDGRGEEALVTIYGGPTAKVTDDENVLTGPTIAMKPKSQELVVDGAGKLIAHQKPDAPASTTQPTTRPARPVEITWEKSLHAQGLKNLAEAVGNVLAKSVEEDGSITTATGQRVMLVMMPKPTSRPTTQPAGTDVSVAVTPQPTTKPSSELDALGGRIVKSLIIQEGAVVESNLIDAGNRPLKMFHVSSELIHWDREQQKLNIPQAGEMLVLDEPAPTTQPVQRANANPMGVKGRMGFKWERSLVYDQSGNQVVFLGKVVVSRMPQQIGNAEPDLMRLDAERVVADLQPAAEAKPTTQPTTRRASPAGLVDMGPRMQLRKVTAEAEPGGLVRINSRQINARADRIVFDPTTNLLTVEGSRQRRAVQLDAANNLPVASFLRVVWNTQTGNIIESTDWQVISRK